MQLAASAHHARECRPEFSARLGSGAARLPRYAQQAFRPRHSPTTSLRRSPAPDELTCPDDNIGAADSGEARRCRTHPELDKHPKRIVRPVPKLGPIPNRDLGSYGIRRDCSFDNRLYPTSSMIVSVLLGDLVCRLGIRYKQRKLSVSDRWVYIITRSSLCCVRSLVPSPPGRMMG